jgi:hypothetical protein
MAVAVSNDGERPFGAITKLFEQSHLDATDARMWSYDVAADGRFVMIDAAAPAARAESVIVVVQNWDEELKRLLTTP